MKMCLPGERIFDRDTGEILTPKTVYTRSDEIAVTIRPRDAGRKGRRFVKLFNSREAKRDARKLTLQENGYIRLLAMYAQLDTNLIVGDGDIGATGLPLTFTQMEELSGLSHGTFLKLLRRLTDIGVVEKVDSRAYRLNRQIASVRRE